MPLEPIEEKDLDTAAKFKVEAEAGPLDHPKDQSQPAQEMVGEIVVAEKDQAYQKILAKVHSPASNGSTAAGVAEDARAAAQKADAESQVKHLVEIASQKGVVYAVKVARHLENNYVLDSFHDKLLAEELHQALLEKGLIEEL